MNNILETALEYLEKYKFSIIPTNPAVKKEDGAKHPYSKVIPYRTKLPTREEVIEWWTKWPNAMIGCITGKLSGLITIDADEKIGIEKMEELLPESFEAVTVKTPRNEFSRHYHFKYQDGLSNFNNGIIELKTENSVITLPGSIRADGKQWHMDNGSSFEGLQEVNKELYKYLLSFSLYTHDENVLDSHKSSQTSQNVTKWFGERQKDNHLIKLAVCLQKGGSEFDFAVNVLNRMVNSWGEHNQKWVEEKVKSAWDMAARRERNIMQEVREWVELVRMTSQTCHISVTEWSQESQNVTKQGKHAARVAFGRLCEEEIPMIERVPGKSGQYRIIDREDNEQKWWLDEGKPLKLVMPLGVEQFTKVFPGNIILLEGQKSQGKSTFALEFTRLNWSLYPKKKVIYQNIEMADSELKERFRVYEKENIIKKEEWPKFSKIIRQTSNWCDKIDPDGINVVDYLIEYEKPYELPKYIFDIHKRLKSGICLCLVQRDPFKPYPTGGRGVRDIPRVIMSIIGHCLRLEDVKTFHQTEFGNPSGLGIKYKQVSYCKWEANGKWERVEESKYKLFQKSTNFKSFTKED